MTARASQSPDAAPAEVWLVDLSATRAALDEIEAATPRLSADTIEKLEQMADGEARRERRAAHVALRLLIERMFGAATQGLAFEVGAKGKPALPIAGDFSLSHIPGRALIAVSRETPIGVDLERDRSIPMPADRRAAIEAAAEALDPRAPLPRAPEARTLQAWVRLEAIGKARGSGIGALLTEFGVTRGALAIGSAAPREIADGFAVYDLDLEPGLYGAVACARDLPRPEVRDLPTSCAAISGLLCVSGPGLSR